MRRWLVLAALFLLAVPSCRRSPSVTDDHAREDDAGWVVTAWGQRFEVYADTSALVSGRVATSNAHVTVLADFSPLKAGSVTAVLRAQDGREEQFRQNRAKYDGMFPVEIKPSMEGTFDLVFVVEGDGESESIPAARVRVGNAVDPGGLGEPRGESNGKAADEVPFLKEQQWGTEFGTAWVREGALAEGVEGPARVRPSGGGEVVLTATVDATVALSPWPHAGLHLAAGGTVFRLIPRVGGRSLPELHADASSLESDVEVARRRVERLTELLGVEATSHVELERAHATLAGLEARLASTREGVVAATSPDKSTDVDSATGIPVRVPWAGRVAEVSVTPGQTVMSGAPLGRLVKDKPLWIIVALRPDEATRVQTTPRGLFLKRPSRQASLEIAAQDLKFVSRSPEVDPLTASVNVILEVERTAAELPIGSTAEAQVLLSGERRGLIVPASALVDDSSVTVVYVQLEGETFARREVRILTREGDRAVVEGVREGDRVVTRGGAAIRRASLLSSGAPEGHVH